MFHICHISHGLCTRHSGSLVCEMIFIKAVSGHHQEGQRAFNSLETLHLFYEYISAVHQNFNIFHFDCSAYALTYFCFQETVDRL